MNLNASFEQEKSMIGFVVLNALADSLIFGIFRKLLIKSEAKRS